MTDLIAMLSTGKGTWLEVSKLIKAEGWDKIYLVTNLFGAQNFRAEKQVNFIIIDPNKDIQSIKETIVNDLRDKLKLDVALNMHSGSGKEHLALISAIVNTGVGIRFVAMKDNEMIEV